MKTATSPRVRLKAGLTRMALTAAATAIALAAGNLFAQPTVKTLGGGYVPQFYGYLNTNTLYALFHTPMGLAANQSGAVFVADRDNNALRELININSTENGDTFTFTTNSLHSPVGVVLDSSGNVYVLNRGGTSAVNTNGTVVEFNSFGILVTTNASHLTNAAAIAIDPQGNLYVTERTNLVIQIPSGGGTPNLIATVPYTNTMLQGIAVMPGGNLAVCDSGRDGIYEITPGGIISTNAGFNGPGDYTGIDNMGYPAAFAQFFSPSGVAAAGDGTLIVSDLGNDRVKVITASGIVTNLYGVSSNDWDFSYYPGWVDGTVEVPDEPDGIAGRSPFGVALSPDGTTLYTTEDYYHIVRKVTGISFSPPPISPPPAPTGLTATIITNNGVATGVLLTWNAEAAGSSVTNYLVEKSTSPNGFTIIGNTSGTTFTDNNVSDGIPYYYVVQAVNSGGESPDSDIASVTIPIPPPVPPTIGYFQYILGGANLNTPETEFFPFTNGPNTFNNDISFAILPNAAGVTTLYIDGPTPIAGDVTNGSTPLAVFQNNETFYPPLPVTVSSNMTIEAINRNTEGEYSAVVSNVVVFQCGNPTITGANAAQFTLDDATTNVTYFYTLDGTDPLTNAPPSQQVGTTNGAAVQLSLPIGTNFNFEVRAVRSGYLPSGLEIQPFSSAAFVPNTISWGFAQGECSSAFVGAAGQTFFAPVTLTMLPGVPIYSLQFNMTVSSTGIGITNPAPANGPFGFNSMLDVKGSATNGAQIPVLVPIPPMMFAAEFPGLFGSTNLPPTDYETNSIGQVFVNLMVSNGDELAVGWVERFGFTNLYPTISQTLITYSQAHDDVFPDALIGDPNGVIVGSYNFQISPGAVNGQQYQLQINQPSATDDGVGANGSAVDIFAPMGTNSLALGPGSLNAIKNVTVGTIPYLVGNVYPFGWFNAGDFGNTNLQNADVEQVFEAAVYQADEPPFNLTPVNKIGGYTSVSDMYDAMDSCGALGVMDNDNTSPLFGYLTNAGPLTVSQQVALMSGNFTNINEMAFGDGVLDVADVYVTFLRSEFTNNLLWFQRMWTNGTRVAVANYAPGVIPSGVQEGLQQQVTQSGIISTPSITNTPTVNFVAGDYQATAGQTVSIPVNATVFGPYPLRMLMLNISVVPLDGSPSLTVPISFAPNPGLSTPLGSANPYMATSSGAQNVSAVWLPNTSSLSTQVPGFTGAENIGNLFVTIPTNATSMSAYAIHFDHASASPSGLICYPKRAFTGLITLSSRTNSYYGDDIPDSWRLRYFGTIYNQLSVSNADADGTGMDNWQKYLAALDPMDSTSVLDEGLDQQAAQSAQDHVVYWPSINNQTYIIMRSPTLFPAQWTAISTNIGDGTYMEIHDSSGGAQGYYEVTTP